MPAQRQTAPEVGNGMECEAYQPIEGLERVVRYPQLLQRPRHVLELVDLGTRAGDERWGGSDSEV